MKKAWATFLLIFLCCALAAVGAEAGKKPIISSKKQWFDPSQGLYFLEGNVYVETASRTITADKATVDVAGLKVWAVGNVTLKQDDLIFTGDSVYVMGGRNTAQITGHLHFVRKNLSISADYAEYNWKTKIATLTGNVVVEENGVKTTYAALKYNVRENRLLP